jgi:hypothetical protein
METMIMVALFISAVATLAAVALSSYDDGPDGFSSA